MRNEVNACRTVFAARAVSAVRYACKRTEKATRGSREGVVGIRCMPCLESPGVGAGGIARSGLNEASDVRIRPAKRRFYQCRHAANLALSRSIAIINGQSTRPRYSSFV